MALLLGKLLMLPFSGRRWTRLLRLFWPVFFFFFLFLFVSSKPVTFLFLRFLPIFSLLCTTWNYAKFHTFLSLFLSPHSDCPLIRSDEALWRNVNFSRKKLKNQNLDLNYSVHCCKIHLATMYWIVYKFSVRKNDSCIITSVSLTDRQRLHYDALQMLIQAS